MGTLADIHLLYVFVRATAIWVKRFPLGVLFLNNFPQTTARNGGIFVEFSFRLFTWGGGNLELCLSFVRTRRDMSLPLRFGTWFRLLLLAIFTFLSFSIRVFNCKKGQCGLFFLFFFYELPGHAGWSN